MANWDENKLNELHKKLSEAEALANRVDLKLNNGANADKEAKEAAKFLADALGLISENDPDIDSRLRFGANRDRSSEN